MLLMFVSWSLKPENASFLDKLLHTLISCFGTRQPVLRIRNSFININEHCCLELNPVSSGSSIWIAWEQMGCRGGSSSSNNHLSFSYLNVTAEKCCLLYQCQKKLVFIQSRMPLLGSWKCVPWCEILQIKAHGFMITWMHPDEQWLSLDYVYSSLPHFIFPLGYSMKWSIAAWHAEKPGFFTCPELVLWSSLCKSLWFFETKQPF